MPRYAAQLTAAGTVIARKPAMIPIAKESKNIMLHLPSRRILDRFRYRSEVELVRSQRGHTRVENRWNHARRKPVTVLQHRMRGLVPAKVVHRADDLAALDEKRSVARHAGAQERVRVQEVRVPEARDEHAALHAGDELRERVVAPGELERARRGERGEMFLLRPIPSHRQARDAPGIDP